MRMGKRTKTLSDYGSFTAGLAINRLLTEGRLVATDSFLSRLSAMKGNGIADALHAAFSSNRDVPKSLNHNWIDVTDVDGMISFTSDRNAETRHGNDPERVYSSRRDPYSVGKFARGILPELGYKISNDKEIEEFVNLYKASKVDTSKRFEIVSGPSIKDYYLEGSYADGAGTLAKSCMRYEKCQPFFKIYTRNTDECRLLVYLDEKNKLLGRALVWKIYSQQLFRDPATPYDAKIEYFMDRVYTVNESDTLKFLDYANRNGWLVKNRMSASNEESLVFQHKGSVLFGRVIIKLGRLHFDNYPYVDTLKFCDGDSLISNVGFYVDTNLPDHDLGFVLNNTDGRATYCPTCDGTGQDPDVSGRCKKCKGKGSVKCQDCNGTNHIMCTDCGGRGTKECNRCIGVGLISCGDCGGEGRAHCKDCEGRGKAVCVICQGKGSMGPCDECQSGKVKCATCNAEPYKCTACEGDGRVFGDDGSVPCQMCAGQGSATSGSNRADGCRCPECSVSVRGGSWRNEGTLICQKCEGEGTVHCPVNCDHGYVDCETCNGRGRYDCKTCRRKGLIKCPKCDGKKNLGKCGTCNGEGDLGACSCDGGRRHCEACNKTGVRGKLTGGGYKCSDCAGLLDDYIVKNFPETRVN